MILLVNVCAFVGADRSHQTEVLLEAGGGEEESLNSYRVIKVERSTLAGVLRLRKFPFYVNLKGIHGAEQSQLS